jgi:hypothetical protein
MPTTAQVIAWAEAYRQAWENADDNDPCTDLREYWQTLPELRDPWPGWGE